MSAPVQNTVALRDIHLPDAISWWPPAIGWWLLLAIIIAAIIFIPRIYRYFTYVPLNKIAENKFQNIISEYSKNNNTLELIKEISILLRQISMSYNGRDSVAQLTGDKWISSLNNMTDKNYFNTEIKKLLTHTVYQKTVQDNPQALITATQNWIAALPKKSVRLEK